jgi:plastocyanin
MRHALGLVLLTTTVSLGACGDDHVDAATVGCEAGEGGTATVAIEDFQFQPDEVTVAAGESVTWANRDGTTHSVWSEERSTGERVWESVGAEPTARAPENLAEGDASTCAFPEPGTYAYLCGIHNSMLGTVVVT